MVYQELGSWFFGPVAHHVRRTGDGAKKPLWANQAGLNAPWAGFQPCGHTLSGRVGCDEACVAEFHLNQDVQVKVLEIVHRTKWWIGLLNDP